MSGEQACKFVRTNLWDYAARSLEAADHDFVDTHLDLCRDCDRCLADVSSLRSGFRSLPAQTPPPLMSTKLRILASRERSRQLMRLNPGLWLRDKFAHILVSFDNFLRPYAVPATGGLAASCLCFSLIAHTLQLRPYLTGDYDMPIGINTEVMMDNVSPFSWSKKDVMVELSVDAEGNVTDFSPMPHSPKLTPEEEHSLAGKVLYSSFTPAMHWGQRVASKRLLSITHIDVQD